MNNSQQSTTQSIFFASGLILFAALSRLLPHPLNFSPIAAMALFGGVYLEKRYSFILPMLAMLLSDFILGFHSQMPFVYGSFLLIGTLGLWLKNHKSFGTIVFSTFASSLIFFILTNLGMWFMQRFYPTPLYSSSFDGLIACFVAAIPFFQNTFVGDVVYVSVMFGAYEAAKKYVPQLVLQKS
ncbi:MAG: hypothetical protein KGZ58_07330 [Ignavibacteriales bacterium]|nr:hypothetical protein [Ignavibacteriales bacterium]